MPTLPALDQNKLICPLSGFRSGGRYGISWILLSAASLSPTHHDIHAPYSRTAAPIRADSWAARAKRRISRPCSPVRLGGSPLK